MIDVVIDTRIDRTPAEVFAYATDPAKLHTWQTNTVSAEQDGDGPIGLGTRLREVHRAPHGKDMASVVEVSEYEPGRVLGLRLVEGALPIHLRMTFEEHEGGTLMRFHAHGQPTGTAGVAHPLLRRVLRRQFEEHCHNPAQVLAGGASAAGAGVALDDAGDLHS